jgi:NAD(P)-dependent dehydrogenase (short-subunit alcohol dehydrogenase family)
MPTVLVTGAARGIGRSIVEHLAARGWNVIAGVRTPEDATAVTSTHPQRVTAITLDVTDPAHIAALPDGLPPTLDAVVNNAGIVVAGPVESLTPQRWRQQFEVNVIGQLAVTQAVLPRLRAARGRVVFISSVNGRIAFPLLGAYCASKFALEAAADALRIELRPWGIAVSVVEPAQTDTDMWRHYDAMTADAEAAMTPEHHDLYARHISGLKKSLPIARRMAGPADRVAQVTERALTAAKPRARYVVGLGPRIQIAFVGSLPTSARDRLMGVMTRLPRRL